MQDTAASESTPPSPPLLLAIRSVIGGALMGLANVIPGVSGGTMLLAVGVYRDFIDSVARLSTLRFGIRPILVTATIALCAVGAIALLARPMSELVINQRSAMYAIFIGLTLGGVPILYRMLKPLDGPVLLATAAGFAVMVVMAMLGPSNDAPTAGGVMRSALLFVSGLAAASAMVLPGISGSYLLLILGQYVALLTTIAALKDGLRATDIDAITATFPALIPFGIGVLVGIIGVSNLVRWLLARAERATLGVLLGLLIGAVIGLYPFQRGVAPEVGSSFRGDTVVERDGALVMEVTGRLIEPQDWPTELFTPSAGDIALAAALIVAGLLASLAVGLLGRQADAPPADDASAAS